MGRDAKKRVRHSLKLLKLVLTSYQGRRLKSRSLRERGWNSCAITRLPLTPPTKLRFDSVTWGQLYIGWVCWFSTLLREVFLWVFRFSPLLKKQPTIWHELVWFDYWFLYSTVPVVRISMCWPHPVGVMVCHLGCIVLFCFFTYIKSIIIIIQNWIL